VGRATLLLGLSSVAAVVGCQSSSAHAFYASRFDPETGCLDALSLGDVLDGPDPGPCNETKCWLDTRGDAHVSLSMCDGPPDWTRVDAPLPGSKCEAALRAMETWGIGHCAPDAGVDGGGDEG